MAEPIPQSSKQPSHQAHPTEPRPEEWQKLMPLERIMLDENVPTKQHIITVCFALSALLTVQDLQRIILPRLLSHPRFCSTLSKRRGVYHFRYDASFTSSSAQISAYHVAVEPVISDAMSEQNQMFAFNASLNRIISTGLDNDRPLWKLHLFPKWSFNPETRANSTTLVLRVHHSIADGIGLVKYFLSRVIDSTDSANLLLAPKSPRPRRNILRACTETVGDMMKIMAVPLFSDPETSFTKPEQNILNHCAILRPRHEIISDLKRAAKEKNATINDILMAAFAGAVRRYFVDLGHDVNKLDNFHTVMPFNQHIFDEFRDEDVSNQLAMLPVRLPIHLEDAEERLNVCIYEMNRMKRSFQPELALAAMRMIATLPVSLRRVAWNRITKSASVLFSNVPGPVSAVTVGGMDLQSIHVFPPVDSNIAVNIAMFSYDNGLFVTVSGDANRLPHPRTLIEYFNDELDIYVRSWELGGLEVGLT